MKKNISAVFTALLTICLSVTSLAQEAYDNFTFDTQLDAQGEPQAVIPLDSLDGADLGISAFHNLSDVFVAADGRIYLTDSGNNRLVVLNKDYTLEKIIDKFDNNGITETFKEPGNVCVTAENRLYIADTGNARVVQLDADGGLIDMYTKPQHPLLPDDFAFIPEKVAVDTYGRIFIISQGCTNGLLQMDKDGAFISFYGALPTKPSPLAAIWRLLQTKEQRAAVTQNIPTVYSNLRVDEKGFIYTTSRDSGTDVMLRRLNPLGTDILKRHAEPYTLGEPNGYYDPAADRFADSQFIAVCPLKDGMYSVLDSQRNRVFAYDYSGNLLYTFGAIGQQFGACGAATSLAADTDGHFIITDAQYNQIVIYGFTEYGGLINKATSYQYTRDYDLSRECWVEVLNYSSKSSLAYKGIGQSLLNNGEYKKAMEYFELGGDRAGWSSAFQAYRMEAMRRFFKVYGVWVVLGLFAIWLAVKITVKVCKR